MRKYLQASILLGPVKSRASEYHVAYALGIAGSPSREVHSLTSKKLLKAYHGESTKEVFRTMAESALGQS